ncbi:MAG: metal-dependent hydrolase [Halobacteriota archaeon]
MGPTHVAMGLVLALPVSVLAPELAPAAALAGMAGGIFPDLDMLGGTHRKTLHFPEYYWALALPAVFAVFVSPSTTSVAGAVFLLSAAVHSVADVFGGPSAPRPWERPSDRGVFFHAGGRWLPPKRWIRYDGAPEDLLVFVVLSAPGMLLFDPLVRALTLWSLAVAVVYTVVRKRVPQLSGRAPTFVVGVVSAMVLWVTRR